jgi:hypothetical protein
VDKVDELRLRRKWTLRALGRQVVFVKKPVESTEHVVMKALIWALYLPQYPDLVVEIPVGDKYKPDVVSLDAQGEPVFWGEAGDVSVAKIRSLARRHKRTHFALGKWATRLDPLTVIVDDALADLHRSAPFDLISFPRDSAERFIDDDGVVRVSHDELMWVRRF